jgi:predicted nucleic acid-binding protein
LLDCLVAQESTLHQPGLFVIEVCATIARRTRDAALAERMGRLAISLPGLQLHELDHSLAARASLLAAQCALRGADAVCVATAQQAAATLLTLDRELIERGAAAAEVLSPAQWMARVAP